MTNKEEKGILTLYSDVQATSVRWLWYPFIAVGKITLLQGDPGDGKSTMMMHLIAEADCEQQLRDQVRGVGADDLPGHAVEPEQYISSGGEKRPQTATCEFRSGHSVFGGKRESSGRKSKPHKAPVWRRIVRCGKFLGLAN